MRVAHLTVGNATWNLRVNFTVNNCELCVCFCASQYAGLGKPTKETKQQASIVTTLKDGRAYGKVS